MLLSLEPDPLLSVPVSDFVLLHVLLSSPVYAALLSFSAAFL